MRIDRLDLIAFGPFTNVVLPFEGGKEGVHLVYGPNEAGKSSALRAIRQFFCGIEARTPDNFLHDYSKMKIGATLRDRSGTTLELVRHKKKKDPLRRTDDTPVDEAELMHFLGGLAAEEFIRKFAIDRDDLLRGGRSVAEENGDLGRLLFAAGASNLGKIGEVLKSLAQEADLLFKKGGRNPLINAKLNELEDLRANIKTKTLGSSEWTRQDRALRDATTLDESLSAQINALTRERSRLRRIHDALDLIAARENVLQELSELAETPRLSADFRTRRHHAETVLPRLERRKIETLTKIERFAAELALVDVPGPILANATSVENLYKRLEVERRDSLEKLKLEAEIARDEIAASAILRDLGRAADGTDESAREALRIKARDRSRIEELANQRQAVWQACEQAEIALKDLDRKIAVARKKLETLGPERSAAGLDKASKKAMRQGDLDASLGKLTKEVATERARAELSLKTLGFWTGPLDQVEGLAVPLVATIEHARDEWDQARSAQDGLEQRINDLQGEIRRNAEAMEANAVGGEVPTKDELDQVRKLRSERWTDLKSRWEDSIAIQFEQLVDRSDQLADRLFQDAARVTTQTRLMAECDRAHRSIAEVRVSQSEASDRINALQDRWRALWTQIGIESPGTPREMLAWLNKHEALAKSMREIREKKAEIEELRLRIDGFRRELTDALVQLGEPAPAANDPLGDFIEQAQEVVQAIGKETKAKEKWKQEVEHSEIDRPVLVEAVSEKQELREQWQTRWSTAMAAIGMPAETLPAEASAMMSRHLELFALLEKTDSRRLQLKNLESESKSFRAEAWNLAEKVAADLIAAGLKYEPILVAETLHERLKHAKTAERKFGDLGAKILDGENELEKAREEIAEQTDILEALCREARCESPGELPAIEDRSERRDRLENDRQDLDARLRKLAGQLELNGFVEEARRADPDTLAADLARLDDEATRLGAEKGENLEKIGGLKELIKQMDGGSDATEINQEAEDLRARVRLDVEQYARLKLAAAVLRSAIERYRDKVQGPVLSRASSLFSGLTGGSFRELQVDADDHGSPVLRGVRLGAEPLGVEAISLGTADQLYLALRLATLETMLDRREPLPLILDDILIQFDDTRTRSALRILAELSKRTQVLIFTHHEHLLRLAEEEIDRSTLFIQRLEPRR